MDNNFCMIKYHMDYNLISVLLEILFLTDTEILSSSYTQKWYMCTRPVRYLTFLPQLKELLNDGPDIKHHNRLQGYRYLKMLRTARSNQ